MRDSGQRFETLLHFEWKFLRYARTLSKLNGNLYPSGGHKQDVSWPVKPRPFVTLEAGELRANFGSSPFLYDVLRRLHRDRPRQWTPCTSAYTLRAVTVRIGRSGTKYAVLSAIIDQYPRLKVKLNPLDPSSRNLIDLPEIHEDAGHTLIHYLCTAQDQLLGVDSLPEDKRVPTELRIHVLVRYAAEICGLRVFGRLPKRRLSSFVKNSRLSIFKVLWKQSPQSFAIRSLVCPGCKLTLPAMKQSAIV